MVKTKGCLGKSVASEGFGVEGAQRACVGAELLSVCTVGGWLLGHVIVQGVMSCKWRKGPCVEQALRFAEDCRDDQEAIRKQWKS